jgi:hypothetical protein
MLRGVSPLAGQDGLVQAEINLKAGGKPSPLTVSFPEVTNGLPVISPDQGLLKLSRL